MHACTIYAQEVVGRTVKKQHCTIDPMLSTALLECVCACYVLGGYQLCCVLRDLDTKRGGKSELTSRPLPIASSPYCIALSMK